MIKAPVFTGKHLLFWSTLVNLVLPFAGCAGLIYQQHLLVSSNKEHNGKKNKKKKLLLSCSSTSTLPKLHNFSPLSTDFAPCVKERNQKGEKRLFFIIIIFLNKFYLHNKEYWARRVRSSSTRIPRKPSCSPGHKGKYPQR